MVCISLKAKELRFGKNKSFNRSFIIMIKRKTQLHTARLTLKSIEDKDALDTFVLLDDKLIKKTYMLPDFAHQEEKEKFFLRLQSFSSNNERFVYGIYLKNKIIGFLNDVTHDENEVEIGYFVDSREWNKGYATEALSAAIKELFAIGFKRVVAAHFESNPASGRVMQKCGMKRIDKTEKIEYRGVQHHCIYYAIEK